MRPLFSIITPTFNGLAGLQRSFASVAAQAPESYEYIIIDAASPDGTAAWLSRQDADSCRWISEPDAGVYDAMNKGIALASGQFLFFLGAGDELLPGILTRVAAWITTLPASKARFLYGDVRVLNRADPILGGRFNRARLCVENISHQAIFYERSIFDMLGNYSLKYPVFADWEFNIRCFADDRIALHYWPEIICDFEGNGLSDRVADMAFYGDRPRLVRDAFGNWVSLWFQVRGQMFSWWGRLVRALQKLGRAPKFPPQ